MKKLAILAAAVVLSGCATIKPVTLTSDEVAKLRVQAANALERFPNFRRPTSVDDPRPSLFLSAEINGPYEVEVIGGQGMTAFCIRVVSPLAQGSLLASIASPGPTYAMAEIFTSHREGREPIRVVRVEANRDGRPQPNCKTDEMKPFPELIAAREAARARMPVPPPPQPRVPVEPQR